MEADTISGIKTNLLLLEKKSAEEKGHLLGSSCGTSGIVKIYCIVNGIEHFRTKAMCTVP